MKLALRKCGQTVAVALPDELIVQLGWTTGDILSADIVDGTLKLVRTTTAHEHAMEIARDVMEEYRETFEALAKN